MEQIKLTKRLQRIFSLAENLINNDNRAILYPIHLFIAALQVKTGVFGELNLKFSIDINSLMKISNQLQFDGKEYIHHYFNNKVSNRTIQVLKEAEMIMNKYGQIYLNEGHIIKAIFVSDNEVIGFGAYDIAQKGLFGPMGIKKSYRKKNVGYTILHSCLNDMNNDGYKYAIIDEAGPIEFYEETCGATIIHK